MPINLKCYYGQDRVFWTTSFIIITKLGFLKNSNGTKLFNTMKRIVKEYARYFEYLLADVKNQKSSNNNGSSSPARTVVHDAYIVDIGDYFSEAEIIAIKTNLDFLLVEFGVHKRVFKHEIIRFLHQQLLSYKSNHNIILRNLSTLNTELSHFLNKGFPSAGEDIPNWQRISFSDFESASRIKSSLDGATHAVGLLDTVAESVRRVFQFSSSASVEDIHRFVEVENRGSLFSDIQKVRALTKNIRETSSVSRHEISEIAGKFSSIQQDLFDPRSPAIRLISSYVVELSDTVSSAFFSFSNSTDYGACWDLADFHKFIEENNGVYVLAYRSALQELVRNIFSNVRHSFNLDEARHQIGVNKLSAFLRRGEMEEDEPTFYYALRFAIKCENPALTKSRVLSHETTLARQISELQSFGGKVVCEAISNGEVLFELYLVGRSGIRADVLAALKGKGMK